ncbi:hypothetical protein B0J17DRAFT_764149 [Rhizoctonia solani]|nr:hypothetical protein B0J17DRAFT_764149 [Rhizoctonia solani]
MMKLTRYSDSFRALSDELVIQVLHFCQYEEILRFSATCRRYNNIIANSIGLQFHIELEVSGLEIINGLRKNATYSLLLDELIHYRDAWLNLQFEEPIEQRSNREMLLWELREGNYAVAFSSVPGTLLAPDSLQMSHIDFPGASNTITFHRDFHEFTFDLGQELVVLLRTDPTDNARLEIQLCSTITRLAHPLAQNPTFIVQLDFSIPSLDQEPQAFTLEIMDNILVARISNLMDPKYEILAWDWKSGKLLRRIASSSGIADFTFLDKDHLALFSVEKYETYLRLITFSLYSLYSHTCDEISNGSYFDVPKYANAHPILTFEFPELDNLYIVEPIGFSVRSDPTPGRAMYTRSAGFAHPTALTFSTTISLAHIRMFDFPDDQDLFQLRVFIDAKLLLHYLLEFRGEMDTITVPWTKWGIQTTRWFLCDQEIFYWLYWTSGSRYISVTERPGSTLHDLSILDFHRPTVRRHDSSLLDYSLASYQTTEYEEESSKIVLEGKGLIFSDCLSLDPSPLPGSTPASLTLLAKIVDSSTPTIIKKGFSVPVESRLPYRVVTKPKFVPKCQDWLIDGNHIVGTNPLHSSSGASEQIFVYKLQT